MSSPNTRVRTPSNSASPPPEQTALPAISDVRNGHGNEHPQRKTSLGFLRRQKSTEPLSVRGGKKQRARQEQEDELRRQREANAVPKQPPKLPDFAPPPQLKAWNGEDIRPDSVSIISNRVTSKGSMEKAQNRNVSSPPMPGSQHSQAPPFDPYARTESMTHRGRYSYASSAISTINSPRRVRRRKDPTPYNVLIIGARNSGKSSFLNFLRTSLALPPKKRPTRGPDEFDPSPPSSSANRNFTSHYLETEIEGERIGLTLWDSQGLEKNIVDLQLRDLNNFLENKFEDTFNEEMKVVRAPGVRDTHIHCVFLILDPVRLDANIADAQQTITNGIARGKFNLASGIIGGLDEGLDLQVFRSLQGKTTVVPVISKADTITTAHMAFLKRTVWDSLKKANLDPLEALNLEEQEEDGDSTNNTNGMVDKFDEREEDEEIARNGNGENRHGSPQSSDSDTAPKQHNPAVRKTHQRRSSGSISSLTANGETPYLPLSILSPDSYSLNPADGPVGRKFPWGFADPYNPEHCDFVKLKESVFTEWRGELREASREIFYERWRTSRLNRHSAALAENNGAKKNGGIFKGGRR